MTADVHRRLVNASFQAQREVKRETAMRDLLQEAVDAYRNQPNAWNPESWVMRAEALLGSK